MTLNRRTFVQGVAAAGTLNATRLAFAADTLKIGYVSPQTGPLAPFGEADKWVIEQMKAAFKDGIAIGGRQYAVQNQYPNPRPLERAALRALLQRAFDGEPPQS